MLIPFSFLLNTLFVVLISFKALFVCLCCQDTVMALHALSIYATFSTAEAIDLTITVNGAFGAAAMFNIDRYNYLLQQSEDLPVCI